MGNELKPCPFCAENSVYIQRCGSTYFVQCLFCGATTRLFTDEQEAVAAWNRRENEN